MKYLSLVIVFLILSCGNKEDILLPKSNVTVVADVVDHSPIYIFFRRNDNDTLAEVNRKNSIITTNWILNIDKRLPLRLVIPEVIKLQEKKRTEKAHVNEKAENYYSYADSVGRNMAFLAFTKVYYKMEKPEKTKCFLHFAKNGSVQSSKGAFSKKELAENLSDLFDEKECDFIFSYDKNMSFGDYIQNKVYIKRLKDTQKRIIVRDEEEFIY